jgi:hypothetical protein
MKEEERMPRIKIPPSTKVTYQETPYWQIQIIPDRIQNDIPTLPPVMARNMLVGGAGYNSRIQKNLDILAKEAALDDNLRSQAPAATIHRAWRTYTAAAANSKDVRNDPEMINLLLRFQRAACTGPYYYTLPVKALKAAFWDDRDEVPLPRITPAESKAIQQEEAVIQTGLQGWIPPDDRSDEEDA